MDDRAGQFVTGKNEAEFLKNIERIESFAERLKAKDGVFTVGDTVTVRGSLFKVENISENLLILRLLPPVR